MSPEPRKARNIDHKEANTWFRKAAEQGHMNAQFGLGVSYEHGNGVEKSMVVADEWYRKAAEQGLGRAQNAVGGAYAKGETTEQSYKLAAHWFSLSAKNGDSEGQFNLASMYRLTVYVIDIMTDYMSDAMLS